MSLFALSPVRDSVGRGGWVVGWVGGGLPEISAPIVNSPGVGWARVGRHRAMAGSGMHFTRVG